MSVQEIEASCQATAAKVLPGARVRVRTIVTVEYEDEEIQMESVNPEYTAQRIAWELSRDRLRY